jgi:hypothetical protein
MLVFGLDGMSFMYRSIANQYSPMPQHHLIRVRLSPFLRARSGRYSAFFILLNTDFAPFFTSCPAYSAPFFILPLHPKSYACYLNISCGFSIQAKELTKY